MIIKLLDIEKKMNELKKYFITEDVQIRENNVKNVLSKLIKLKKILGNLDNDIHFLASFMANSYLKEKHGLEIDLSKPEGKSGLDIEVGDIAGEIKTTFPYYDKDFGANQRKNIIKDIERLELSPAKYKYFFVIDNKTERILRQRYCKKYPSVKIINLSTST
jgi:hypothetical protein